MVAGEHQHHRDDGGRAKRDSNRWGQGQ